MIKVGIVGATGYGGREILRLLGLHPQVRATKLTSTSAVGEGLEAQLPGFRGLTHLVFEAFDAEALASTCDVVFVGVPGSESTRMVAALRAAGVRTIDIGPDFRLKDTKVFAQYYKTEHEAPQLLAEAIYGFPPFYREALKTAQLVAGPGCYPISVIVPLRPIVEATSLQCPPVIDAVSGTSGAGRSLKESFHFSEMNENVWAYKLAAHQHIPEIEQELLHKTMVQFTPHVGPYTRGILSTITIRPSGPIDLDACFARYAKEPFVRVLGEGRLPELNHVRASNFCDFGWVTDKRTGNIVIVSAVDNLMGGTAGIAIQCMNLMFGLDETAGLSVAGMSV